MTTEAVPQLVGQVEVDETYVDGRERNKSKAKRPPLNGTAGKIPVIGALARQGLVVRKVISIPDTPTLQGFVTAPLSLHADLVVTDEHSGYRHLAGAGEYVRGPVHTQTIESLWSLLKRGIMGAFHHVSQRHVPFYLDEFTFRHNYRADPHLFDRVLITG